MQEEGRIDRVSTADVASYSVDYIATLINTNATSITNQTLKLKSEKKTPSSSVKKSTRSKDTAFLI